MDIKIKPGFVYLDAGYKKVDNPNEAFSAKLQEALRQGPMEALKDMGTRMPGMSDAFAPNSEEDLPNYSF